MPPTTKSPVRQVPADRGFALLITITLVAFLVLILVGLASFTRVETQVASNSQAQVKARQNALLGLQIAIGQLQKLAGPDQRITATADLVATQDRAGAVVNRVGTTIPVSNKQTVANGARHWTGIWGNSASPNDNVGQPRFLNWLVSGNENVVVSATENGTDFGRITSNEATGASLPVKATDAIGLALSTQPTDDVSIPSGTKKGRLLVGPRSAGATATDLPNYVVAPLVEISAPSKLIPGLGSAAGNTVIGGYAYWVGDEGVKARLNLTNPWPESTNPTDAANERSWSFANAQRAAGERMDGLSALSSDPAVIGKLLAPGQLNFAANPSITPDVIVQRSHDFSLYSRSVLSDVRRGGLKRDLTRILETGGGSADEANNATLFPHLGSSGDPFYARPATWGILRDFAAYGSAPYSAIQPRAPSANTEGVSPVLMFARMDYTYTVDAPVGAPATQTWHSYISPFFILWNPYNRTLKGGRYEIGVQGPRKTIGTDQQGIVNFELTLPPLVAGDPPPPNQTMWLNLGNARFEHPDYRPAGYSLTDPWNPPTTDREFFRFTAVAPDLAPGEAVVIGMNNNTNINYIAGMQLNVRTYLDRKNYSNVVRIRTHSLSINAADRVSVSIPKPKHSGEVNAYLGIEGAGANPAAAQNGSYNYHQWIGRVEVSTPSNSSPSFGPDESYIKPGTSGSPRNIAGFHLWHQLGVANISFTAPLESRWVAAANPRAYMVNRTGMEYGGDDKLVVNPVYHGLINAVDLSGGDFRLPILANDTEAPIGNDYSNSSFNPYFRPRPILFELPESNQPLFSIANLQHAAVAAHATSPAYAIGNSLADFRVASGGLDKTALSIDAGYLDPVGGADFGPRAQIIYDQSYLLNHALWDRYFFSTIPYAAVLPDALPNSRLALASSLSTAPNISDFLADKSGRKTAANLLLEGGFNINSTSENAWKSFLGSTFGLRYDPLVPQNANPSEADSPSGSVAFSRFRHPLRGWQKIASNDPQNVPNYYRGYRRLTSDEIDGLARRMVAEVRERGPFLSVAEFVNRSLTASTDRMKLKGALQAAVDDEATSTPRERINIVTETSIHGGGRHIIPPPAPSVNAKNPDSYAPFSNVVAPYHRAAYVGFETNTLTIATNGNPPDTRNDAFFPGYLTQADLLATLGSAVTARSDTFVVRAYGETINPITKAPEGRAWCEAVVQRTSNYINATEDDPETEVSALTNIENRRLGRQFEIVSFRWLNAEDI